MGKFIDLTGQRFGRWTVIERAENDKRGKTRWLCQCECGNKSIVYADHLRGGRSASCGCVIGEKGKQYLFKHGETNSRLYRIWKGMRERCRYPHHRAYKNYGGRGITVCEEWRNSYVAFRDWALSHGYADDLTIDRIDNNKGYCPENCRWSSYTDQARNRRSMHLIEYNGKTQTIAEWACELGMRQGALWNRLRSGWSVERALTTPVRKQMSPPKKQK